MVRELACSLGARLGRVADGDEWLTGGRRRTRLTSRNVSRSGRLASRGHNFRRAYCSFQTPLLSNGFWGNSGLPVVLGVLSRALLRASASRAGWSTALLARTAGRSLSFRELGPNSSRLEVGVCKEKDARATRNRSLLLSTRETRLQARPRAPIGRRGPTRRARERPRDGGAQARRDLPRRSRQRASAPARRWRVALRVGHVRAA